MKKMLKAGTHAVSVDGVEFIADEKGMIDVDNQTPEVLAALNQLAEVRDLTAEELASLEPAPVIDETPVVKKSRKRAVTTEESIEPTVTSTEGDSEANAEQA